MEEKYYIGIVRFNTAGHAFFSSEELQNDIFVHKTNTGKALHLDRVKLKTQYFNGKLDGVVVEVLERHKTKFVGTIEPIASFSIFRADSNKIHTGFFVKTENTISAKMGQKVVAELMSWKDNKSMPEAKIVKVLGAIGENETEMHSIMVEYDLPYEFPEEVELEAEAITGVITEEEIAKRKDARHLLTCTIDGETAKDLDDALSVEFEGDNVVVGVHIADVSHYVKVGSEIDKEALKRSTSVYLVDRCVPMLPQKLSNDLCSLNPNTDKLVYSFYFTLDKNADIIKQEFVKGIINSDYRLTYTEVQKVIEGGETYTENLKTVLLTLDEYAKKLRHKRSDNQLQFVGSEVKFILDENSKPVDFYVTEQTDANQLIEEFMVLTNIKVCEYLTKKSVPTIHRAHDIPDMVRLQSIKEFAEVLGYQLDLKDDNLLKKSINKLLGDVKGTPEENVINNLVVRTMAKANYQTVNIGHYGMGLQFYGHKTSPIRRMADLCCHRILSGELYPQNELEKICKHISAREVLAQKAERDSVKYKQVEFMEGKEGQIFEGVVTSIADYGMFIELAGLKCEGMVRPDKISSIESYNMEPSSYRAVGMYTGNIIRLGDVVKVVVNNVDVGRKTIDLTMVNFLK